MKLIKFQRIQGNVDWRIPIGFANPKEVIKGALYSDCHFQEAFFVWHVYLGGIYRWRKDLLRYRLNISRKSSCWEKLNLLKQLIKLSLELHSLNLVQHSSCMINWSACLLTIIQFTSLANLVKFKKWEHSYGVHTSARKSFESVTKNGT